MVDPDEWLSDDEFLTLITDESESYLRNVVFEWIGSHIRNYKDIDQKKMENLVVYLVGELQLKGNEETMIRAFEALLYHIEQKNLQKWFKSDLHGQEISMNFQDWKNKIIKESNQKPQRSNQQPKKSNQQPQTSNQQPQQSQQQQQIYNQQPQTSNQQPQHSNQQPQRSNQQPQKSQQQPQKSNQQPQRSNQQPQESQQKPQQSNQQPQRSNQQRQHSHQQPQQSNQQPQRSNQKPQRSNQQPQISHQQPQHSHQQQQQSNQQPQRSNEKQQQSSHHQSYHPPNEISEEWQFFIQDVSKIQLENFHTFSVTKRMNILKKERSNLKYFKDNS